MMRLTDLLRDTGAIGLLVRDAGDADWEEAAEPGLVRIGVHRSGPLPARGLDAFDILLTTIDSPAVPWVGVRDMDAELDHLRDLIGRQPFAAAVLAQLLRLTLSLDFGSALLAESFAYSTLLASGGFRAWHEAMPEQRDRADHGSRILLERVGDTIHIVLNRPRGRNAIDAAMRDALCDALDFARLDPDRGPVVLRGQGAVFSVGGDLAEFGQASDPAAAHAIRTLRSPARLLYAIRDRVEARLHGPCVGAGIEIPAAVGRVVARPGTSFRLPEVMMGIIPGAGGTATVPRRIGRHRACWMATSGRPVDLDTALAWGLVDAEEG